MSEMKNLKDLLKHQLEDLYSAEEQIIEALPGMVSNASDRLLKNSLTDHLKVTKKQLARLDKVKKMLGQEEKEEPGMFEKLFSSGEKHHCRAMEGLIEEGEKTMEEDMEPEVKDAAIIASAQRIEHYEISGYGTAKAFALHLGFREAARLLDETLQEEYDSDDLLTQLAIGKVNLEAGGEEEITGLRKLPAKKKSTASPRKTGRTAGRSSSAKRGTTKSTSGSRKSAAKKSR